MKGTIVLANLQRGRYAAESSGELVCFEVLGGHEPELEDVVSGALDAHGGEALGNLTQGESFDVFIEILDASPVTARAWVSGQT